VLAAEDDNREVNKDEWGDRRQQNEERVTVGRRRNELEGDGSLQNYLGEG
jgi:hypothetical protein